MVALRQLPSGSLVIFFQNHSIQQIHRTSLLYPTMAGADKLRRSSKEAVGDWYC